MNVVSVGKSRTAYQKFPEHSHGYWEILLNLTGSGSMTIGTDSYDYAPGDIFVIPPMQIHKKKADTQFTDIGLFVEDFTPIGRNDVKKFSDDEHKSITTLMNMAYTYYQSDNDYKLPILNAIADTIYQLLASFYNEGHRKDLRLENLLELMHQRQSDSAFNLSAAIDSTGYSKGYFRKIFKEATGMSPVQYLHHLRIEQAKSLFHRFGSSKSIKEISSLCGFTDVYYFSRIFKQIEGVNPSDFIRHLSHVDYDKIKGDTPPELW